MYRYYLAQNQLSAKNEGTTVILRNDINAYYSLNDVGSHVWDLLNNGYSTLQDLKKSVVANFEVDEATCEKDILILLDQLIDEKLVEKVEGQ